MDHSKPSKLPLLALAALGIVFGDIGTSPLYALRECFHGEFGIVATQENIIGVVSLILWSLISVITLKYITLILRADHEGEGGVLILSALSYPNAIRKGKGKGWILAAMGLFAACLLYGDGMITPAISVLSAVEGLEQITPRSEPFVIPITVAILAALFFFQSRGTDLIGKLFGPIILVWFSVLGILGVLAISEDPRIFLSINPSYGINFLLGNS